LVFASGLVLGCWIWGGIWLRVKLGVVVCFWYGVGLRRWIVVCEVGCEGEFDWVVLLFGVFGV